MLCVLGMLTAVSIGMCVLLQLVAKQRVLKRKIEHRLDLTRRASLPLPVRPYVGCDACVLGDDCLIDVGFSVCHRTAP